MTPTARLAAIRRFVESDRQFYSERWRGYVTQDGRVQAVIALDAVLREMDRLDRLARPARGKKKKR